MRTLIAMICAMLAAGLAVATFSQNIADNVVATWKFDAPPDVTGAHTVTYLLITLAALLAGWCLGWLLGFPVRRQRN